MLNIDLKINQHLLNLGHSSSSCANYLNDRKTRKAGFLWRFSTEIFLSCSKNETLYFNKNCEIDCFNSKFIMKPQLKVSMGTEEMYGTSAFIFFQNNTVSRIIFQLYDNRKYAPIFSMHFKEICEEKYGKGVTSETNGIYTTIWEDLESQLKIEYNPRLRSTFFTISYMPSTASGH